MMVKAISLDLAVGPHVHVYWPVVNVWDDVRMTSYPAFSHETAKHIRACAGGCVRVCRMRAPLLSSLDPAALVSSDCRRERKRERGAWGKASVASESLRLRGQMPLCPCACRVHLPKEI